MNTLINTPTCDRITEELAALRRLAMLVARGAPPEEVFAAVTTEAGRLINADRAAVGRYDPDTAMTTVARWSAAGNERPGTRTPLGGRNMATLVFETGRPARMDDSSQYSGPGGEVARGLGIRSSVGVPITVEGRLWGAIIVSNAGGEKLPADAEARLAGFSELIGAAIANAQAHVELRGYAEGHAALRRVAMLVAGGPPQEQVFAAVAEEFRQVASAECTSVSRYHPDGTATIIGAWARAGSLQPPPVGGRLMMGGRNMTTLVYQTGEPARIDDYSSEAFGTFADVARGWGARSAIGVPIRVDGRLWGVVNAWSAHKTPLPTDAEARLVACTELVGMAIVNAEAQAALAASRARIVAAADEARRRIERDLHDGAQQRLVTLALQLRQAQAAAPPGAGELVKKLDGVAAGLVATLDELREIAHGIHPVVLSQGGLRPALAALARRSPVPVDLDLQVAGRLPDPVENAGYYVICEALTNTAKHAAAATVQVAAAAGGELRIRVGADFGRGSGLIGLQDRVEAIGGRIALHSPPGADTTLEVHIPMQSG
jgi:signal transduction histidine kinase